MVDVQTVLTYLTLISVPIGVFYHILTLWNSQKSRQTQILLQLYQTMSNSENNRILWELMAMEWDDYDDFQAKHSPQVDPENASKRQALWNQYEGLGLLVMNKVVDLNTVYRTRGSHILMVWFKFESIIKRLRIDEDKPIGDEYLKGFEFLADKMTEMRITNNMPLPTLYIHPTSGLFKKYNR